MFRLAAGFVLLSLGVSPGALGAPEQGEPAAVASAEPPELAALAARRVAAEAREAAVADWLGAGDAPPGDPDLLRVHLAASSARGVSRAAERIAPPPRGLTEPQVEAWRAAVRDATDAEERADAAEGRLVAGLLAGLERAPGLTDDAVAEWEASLPTPPADPAAAVPADVLVAYEDARQLRIWRRAAFLAMIRPGSTELAALVSAALAAEPTPTETSDALRDRLVRVMPLLDPPLAWQAGAWVAQAPPLAVGEPPVEPEADAAAVVPAPIVETVPALVVDPGDASRRADAVARIAAWRAEIDRLRHELEEAELRTALDRQRQPQRDAAYLGLREVVAQLHTAVIENYARVRALPGDLAAADESHATVELLVEAKGLRREARALATGPAREGAQRAFIPEVIEETQEIPAVWAYHLERTARRVAAVPALLTDITALYALVTRSLLFFAGVAAWWFLRTVLPGWLASAARALDEPGQGPRWTRAGVVLSAWLESPGDYGRLTPLLRKLGRRLVDVCGASALVWWMRDDTPGLYFLATLLFAFTAWRVWRPVLDLVLATPEDDRPALWVVDARSLRSVRVFVAWLVGWWLVVSCADVLLRDVLAAFKWAQLVDSVATVFGIAIVCAALWTWEPDIRAGLAQLHQTPIVRRIAAPGRWWSRIPRAIVALVTLALFHAARLTAEIVASSRSLRWVGSVLARRQLAQDAELEPLDAALLARVETLEHGVPPKVKAAVTTVLAAHVRWSAERTGMAAVMAERGAGLRLVPDLLAAALDNVRRVPVPRRMTEVADARKWLAESLGVPDGDELVAGLQGQPASSIVVHEAHLLFVRRAGGFDALRWVLETMQATSEEHFWVLCTDTYTWTFLQDTPGTVDLGGFDDRIHVEAMTPVEIGAWLLDPMEAAGLGVSFSALARGAAPGDRYAEARARKAYLRVLADLAQGRPEIARSLWHTSLRAGDNGVIEHAVPAVQQGALLDLFGDEDLFVLTALVTHAGLALGDLADVLNREAIRVQSVCRRLQGRGILVGDEQGTWFDVADVVHPIVVRVLKQRAFLDVI